MKVESIAPLGVFCNSFDLHLAIISPENHFWGLFESGRFTHFFYYTTNKELELRKAVTPKDSDMISKSLNEMAYVLMMRVRRFVRTRNIYFVKYKTCLLSSKKLCFDGS